MRATPPRDVFAGQLASLGAMTRRLVVALATLGLLLLGAPAARAAITVVNVSARPTSQSEAAVAASRLDPNDVVVASNVQRGYGIFVSVSHDGGATWIHKVLGDGDTFGRACCDPTITWDRRGNLFLSWLGFAAKPYPSRAIPGNSATPSQWLGGPTARNVWCFSVTCVVWRPACRFWPMADARWH